MNFLETIKENAERAIKMFAVTSNANLNYDEKSVKFLDNFINESGFKYNEQQKEQLINLLGSFLGECICRNYGGNWEIINNESAVRFDTKNAVFPFNKIKKQFENGSEDSILSFYQIIPIIFNLNNK